MKSIGKDLLNKYPSEEMSVLFQDNVILDELVTKYYEYLKAFKVNIKEDKDMYAGVCFAVLTLGGEEALQLFEYKWQKYCEEEND